MSPTVWLISLKSSSTVVNQIACDGGSRDRSGNEPWDGAVDGFVEVVPSEDAESIGDVDIVLGLVGRSSRAEVRGQKFVSRSS